MKVVRHAMMTRIADACADDAEILALSIMRMVMAGYATGDVACWDLAYAGAERHLRPETAGRLVASLITLARAVRAERTGDWHFMPASCCRVTTDEETIIRLLAAARGGDAPAIARAAADVTGSPFSPGLETAARVVAGALDVTAASLDTKRSPPGHVPPSVH